MALTTTDERIERLSSVSANRIIEPDEAVVGQFGPGQIVPDELLLTAGLDLELDADTRRRLAIEQTAALVDGGIRLETVLMAGFGFLIAAQDNLDDPRVVYMLHELGEETRHSRLFVRLLGQLQPTAKNPFRMGFGARISDRIMRWITKSPVLLCTMVLAGEEIPDLIQRRQAEHPDTDDYVRRVNQYHRQEEARHLAFARMLLPELWGKASRRQRFVVKRLAPSLTRMMLQSQLIHPGIYSAVGLPAMKTWRAVQHTPQYRDLQYQATRPLLEAVISAAPEVGGRVPRGWRRLCGVDRQGQPSG
jgi:hypothetical protein